MKIRPAGTSVPRLPAIGRAKVQGAQGGRTEAPAAAGAGRSEAVNEVVARIRAGEVTPQQAVSLLVDHTLSKLQGASPALRRKMRAALEQVAAEDPTLLATLERARRK
jgi:hypothetical protein